ncbi:formimidoylglutamase [Sediminicola luteus]|uniref:Arginase n=1 Tax=Sediminicola luteus TaxID=319238 RepID=A0A2A4GBQ3_9FLAO|nr:formimidoylglutamase [Sediminicola luteus]PCE65841.1 arginase [Sediminicola luteus]
MAFDFLVPVADKVLAHCELLPEQALGASVFKHTAKKGLPVLANATVAIMGVRESRNAFEKKIETLDTSAIRLELYKLMRGNWNATIVDLGDVEEGDTVEDTYFVVNQICAELIEEKVIPIIIGHTQDITYPSYRAYDGLKPMVNMVSVDSRFDFGLEGELISSHSYMSKIITEQPANLFQYANIGYQSYFVAQEELDLMERLFFDSYRLGNLVADITLAEPLMRDAHIVSVDMRSVRGGEVGFPYGYSPNGFSGPEICAIARYAGMGNRISTFGVYEMENNHMSQQLVAQVIWYFIEGLDKGVDETPYSQTDDFTRYTVPTEMEELVFFKSHLTERWWVEVPSSTTSHNKSNPPALLPCTEADYLEACSQNIPERWYRAYKKGFH